MSHVKTKYEEASVNKHDKIRELLCKKQDEHTQGIIIKYTIECEATEKELEEIKAMIKDIGDGAISFETSYQRMVFEALMNKIGRTSKVCETK